MALIYCNGDTKMEDEFAKRAAETLTLAYPNHSWWIECRQGVLVIKHFGITGERIGMVRHMHALQASHTAFKKDILAAAGELLERAGVRRGAYTGDAVGQFETGSKELDKKWRGRPPMRMKVIH